MSACATAEPTVDVSSTTVLAPDSTTADGSGATTRLPEITSTTESITTELPVDRGDVSVAFPITSIVIAGVPYVVALAADPDLRAQGLMGVTSLGDLDGMLFEFPEESELSFWMKDTLISLDIAFFDEEASLVSVQTMTPCTSDPCELYGSGEPARYAVEVPAGLFDNLPSDAMLIVGR